MIQLLNQQVHDPCKLSTLMPKASVFVAHVGGKADCFHLCLSVCALSFGWRCLKKQTKKQPKKNFKELMMTLQCVLYST